MLRAKPLAFALLLTAFDAFWAYQALSAVPRNTSDTVGLSSLVVWVVFHLPAASLASWVAPSSTALMAGLGLLETLGLSWGAFAWLGRKKEA